MKKSTAGIVLAVAALALMGCGKEFSRLPIDKEDLGIAQEGSFSVEPGKKVSLWADLDLEYAKPFGLEYRVTVREGETVLLDSNAQAIDPPVRIASLRVQLKNSVRERFQGSLGLSFVPSGPGPVTVSVTVLPGTNLREFRKGDLVLKR